MEIKSVTIIGLGVIGGSLAKALRRIDEIEEITGIDTNEDSLDKALAEGVLDRAFTIIDKNIHNSDLVFVCTPINRIIDYIEKLINIVKPSCIITDTGSIKGELVQTIESSTGQINFIGGHPMCGSEKSGYEASRRHLFENAYYILTPTNKTLDKTIEFMEKIIIAIGGIPVIINSKMHDTVTGAISHVPHVISAALVNLVQEMDYKEKYMQKLAAGGFKDITRIASAKPEMWQNIAISNKDQIKNILRHFSEKVNQFIILLDNNNSQDIYDFFDSAKRYRDSFTSRNVGLIAPFYDLSVDIEDKPGEIGKLATLLGQNEVNIKNINVSNSREFEHGCLKITFSDLDNLDRAYKLLKSYGYTVQKSN